MQLNLFQHYNTPKPRYGGHENQPLQRFWLQKAVKTVSRNPRCWQSEPTCLSLGLSASRWRSLLFWSLAFKVILPQGSPGCYVVSAWGDRLLGVEGTDPCLEDLSSLWLLHWQLLSPPCYANVWGWFFGHTQHRVTEVNLVADLKEWSGGTVAEGRLRADIRCLLKMYCPQPQKLEDALLNLFGDVPLLRQDGDQYERVTGYRAGLSSAVLLYCCLDYAHTHTVLDIKVSRCAYGKGSPGVVFGLSSAQLLEALAHAAEQQPGVTLSHSLDGGYQLSWSLPAQQLLQAVWQRLSDGEPWTQKAWF